MGPLHPNEQTTAITAHESKAGPPSTPPFIGGPKSVPLLLGFPEGDVEGEASVAAFQEGLQELG